MAKPHYDDLFFLVDILETKKTIMHHVIPGFIICNHLWWKSLQLDQKRKYMNQSQHFKGTAAFLIQTFFINVKPLTWDGLKFELVSSSLGLHNKSKYNRNRNMAKCNNEIARSCTYFDSNKMCDKHHYNELLQCSRVALVYKSCSPDVKKHVTACTHSIRPFVKRCSLIHCLCVWPQTHRLIW